MFGKREHCDKVIQLWSPVRERAYRVVLCIVKDREMTEDVLQEALVTAIEKFQALRDESKFEPWFIRIAVCMAYETLANSNSVPVQSIGTVLGYELEGAGPDEGCRQEMESLPVYNPDFHKIETAALPKFKHRYKMRVRRIWVQATAAVAAAFIIVNGAVILSAVPGVKAYGETIRNYFMHFTNNAPKEYDDKLVVQTTEALRDIQEKVPYQIPFPHWLPEGYEVANTDLEVDVQTIYKVRIQYNKPNMDRNNAIGIYMTNGAEFAKTKPSPGESLYEKKEIEGYDVYIRVKGENPKELFYCMFFYNDLIMEVSGPLDIKSFTQILVSLQP